MMTLKITLILALLFGGIHHSIAQVRATTESGNKVLLFDDGTWKYDESPVTASVSAAVASFEVDSTKIVATEQEEAFFVKSPRLARYFGDSGSNIRLKLSCSNTKGDIRIHFGWEFPVGDGHRYYGTFKEGSIVKLTMEDGQTVELVMSDENEIKKFESQNYSAIFNASIPLTLAQITTIYAQPITVLEVGWRKKPEEYEVKETRLLMEMLAEVL